ncbi:MAG: PP2C family protein-serine/threonine phosphatase [bacterium]
MSQGNFRIIGRILESLRRIQTKEISWGRTLIYSAIWFLSFAALAYPAGGPNSTSFAIFIVHVIFWFRLVDELVQRLRPPNELLILLVFPVYLLESALLQAAYRSGMGAMPSFSLNSVALVVLQIITLAGLILPLSVFLVQNCQGKKGVLIGFVLVAWIGVGMVESESASFDLLLQMVLFVLLLRRTTWLEALTKAECWLYLVLGYFAFRWLSGLQPFSGISAAEVSRATLWFSGPKFLFFLFKMYLLAVLVKIPIVLVYNFASLSRKLKISSLFQSTFPQIIQLGMLLIIFYFFVVGLQAEKLRKAVFAATKRINSTEDFASIRIGSRGWDSHFVVAGYVPLRVPEHLPELAIVALDRDSRSRGERDYFIFLQPAEQDSVSLIKIDSTLLTQIEKDLSILAGSELAAYPYSPHNWETYVYNFSLGDLSFWGERGNLQIFPFAVHGSKRRQAVSISLGDTSDAADWQVELDEEEVMPNPVATGRVIASVFGANETGPQFFAFEILSGLDLTFFTTTLLSFILFLTLVYFLVNLLITRRMVRFGSEINRSIVQKFSQLRDGIREISGGNLDYKVKIEGKDEFVELAERFNQMGDNLKASIAETREKERLQHELTIARQVQLDLLPRKLPEVPGFEIAAILKTANEVGGDFYDVLELDDKHYLFTIGDVSGKGTSAAFYMAQCISLIRYSPQFTDRPDKIACRLNKYFSDPMVDRQVFVTAIIGVLNVKESRLRFVRAGHPLPLFIPGDASGEIGEIETRGLGIGLEKNGRLFEMTLEQEDIALEPGDMLVFYTDGVEEAARAGSNPGTAVREIEFYTPERLKSKLSQLRGQTPAAILDALTEDIKHFYGGSAQVDDYTLLIIQKAALHRKDASRTSL